ncbi:unnamed protein product [Ixodes persulcatus]
MSFLAAAGLLKLGLILSVMFLRKGAAKPNVLVFKMPDDVRLVPFKNHTTVADTPGLCDPISRRLFWNRVSRQVYRENEILRQPTLALTLIQIAHQGYRGFLQGDMGAKFLLDLRQLGDLMDEGALTYHRLVETFKFTLPFREDLGDDQFEDVGEVSSGLGLFVPCRCHGLNGS